MASLSVPQQFSVRTGDAKHTQGCLIAGVDEAGRGPLAGPVVAAAVILSQEQVPHGLADSKRLSAKQRAVVAERIRGQAAAWSIAYADVAEIDRLNILNATLLAMSRAVDGLGLAPDWVQVDGNRCPQWRWSSEAIVGGDAIVPVISAASILAKQARDEKMLALHARYPDYGFAEHKGYPTPVHLARLAAIGPCPEHRKSYRPVREALDRGLAPLPSSAASPES